MQSGYTQERDKLGKLAAAASVAAQEFERTLDERAAAAAQLLFSLIETQFQAVDDELDRLIEKAGI
jgi:hypothetical protein